jgi:hypothetical protein
MLALTIIATAVAALSGLAAWRSATHAKATVEEATRSADAAESSVAEARRSADAAERAAGAATITAETDRAADHRARTPDLRVTVDKMVEHNGKDAIYRVLNNGSVDVDSVTVYRPVDVENRIVHGVAPVGVGDYTDVADLGGIPAAEYAKFVLSLGVAEDLPDFRVRMVCRIGDEEWSYNVPLDNPRKREPVSPVSLGGFNQGTERSIMDIDF